MSNKGGFSKSGFRISLIQDMYMNFIESFLVKKLKFLSHFWKFFFFIYVRQIVEFLGAITRPRSSVFKSTKPGEADWSIVHMDTLVLTNQRRPLIFRVHVDNLLTNEDSPIILVRTQLRSVVFSASKLVKVGPVLTQKFFLWRFCPCNN